MDNIKMWILSICISSIVGGVFYIIVPDGSLGKTVKVVITVFLLSCVILPFSGNKIDFTVDDFDIDTNNKYSEILKNNITDKMKEIITENISSVLKKRKYDYRSIEINTDKNENSDIYIKEIIIVLPKKYRGNSYNIKQEIKYKTGYDVRVEYENT